MTVRGSARSLRSSGRDVARALVIVAAFAGAFTAIARPAAAAAVGPRLVLKGAPFKAFTEEDTRQFIDAARTAAESTDPEDETRWANEASGSWGTMAVTRRFKRQGAQCREIRGENTAGGRTDPFRIVLCRAKDEWKVISSGPVRK